MNKASSGGHRAHGHHRDPGDPVISNTVTTSVTLGVAPYFNPLTITPTGAIVPTARGATALIVPASVIDAIVVNQGRIAGAAYIGSVSGIGGAGGLGVQFASAGTLTNNGTILGGSGGNGLPVLPRGQAPGGTGGIGADLTAGGTLMNTGTIVGGSGGSGRTLGGGGAGVDLAAGGTLTNTGTISGGTGGTGTFGGAGGVGGVGVFLNGGTLTNSGTVAGGAGGSPGGSRGAAVQFGTAAATLVVTPGAIFNGQVIANAAVADVLVLGGTSAGTLTGLGTSFVNFSSIAVSQNANWTFTGANTATKVLNNGTARIAGGGSLDVSSAVDPSSSGLFQLTGNATFEVATALGTNEKIQFLGGTTGNKLIIDKASTFGTNVGRTSYAGALLENFTAGDVIDLKHIASTGLQLAYSAASGDLQITGGGSALATLMFQNATLGSGTFHTASDGSGGTLITHG